LDWNRNSWTSAGPEQSRGRAEPEQSQSRARAEPEQSQSRARAEPEQSQSRARAEPEQSQSSASRTEVALHDSKPHLSLRLHLRPFVLKQSWGTYNCKGLAVLTGAAGAASVVGIWAV